MGDCSLTEDIMSDISSANNGPIVSSDTNTSTRYSTDSTSSNSDRIRDFYNEDFQNFSSANNPYNFCDYPLRLLISIEDEPMYSMVEAFFLKRNFVFSTRDLRMFRVRFQHHTWIPIELSNGPSDFGNDLKVFREETGGCTIILSPKTLDGSIWYSRGTLKTIPKNCFIKLLWSQYSVSKNTNGKHSTENGNNNNNRGDSISDRSGDDSSIENLEDKPNHSETQEISTADTKPPMSTP